MRWRRVAAISSERSRPVKLSLARDLLVLSAASPEQGTATEELDADHVKYEAGPLEIGFQARYLNDITDQIDEQVEFRFADGSAPTVVQDAADASALYVLMPMRVCLRPAVRDRFPPPARRHKRWRCACSA